jgi:multidrug efflux pump subunit AcrA (membrane-fusion protein)
LLLPQKQYNFDLLIMNRSGYISVAAGIIILAVLAWLFLPERNRNDRLFVPVKKGTLNIEVSATGELTAKKSILVNGPAILAAMQIYEIKLQSIIPEGSHVEAGDIIATLEPKNINTMIKQVEDDCRDGKVKLDELLLDTTQTLKESQDQIRNLEFDYEQARIVIRQSVWEDKVTQERALNDSSKAKRTLENAKTKYRLEKTKAENKVRNARFSYNEKLRLLAELHQTRDSLMIRAPQAGMLVYHKNHMGEKILPGSSLSPNYEFIVAELPDLSQMKSVTGINEIDIDKVQAGQPVSIAIDAFPGKTFMGHVTEVANMGMEDPRTGTKIFEVVILLDGTHSILRPGMTSKNTIVTGAYRDVLYLPVDAVFGEAETGAFVYKKSGSKVARQPVVTGVSNEAFIIIREGLSESDEVSLTEPG